MDLQASVLAQEAYEAYSRFTGNKNFKGEEMPKWQDLPAAIKGAWAEAACSVVLKATHTAIAYTVSKLSDTDLRSFGNKLASGEYTKKLLYNNFEVDDSMDKSSMLTVSEIATILAEREDLKNNDTLRKNISMILRDSAYFNLIRRPYMKQSIRVFPFKVKNI